MELKKKKGHYCMGNFSITHKEGCFVQIKITKALGDEVPWGSITKHYIGNGNSAFPLDVCSDLYTEVENNLFLTTQLHILQRDSKP